MMPRPMTLEMAWRTRPLQLVLSGGSVTPTLIRKYNGLRGENRGPFKGQQASASNPVKQVFALAREGMLQSDITGRFTVHRILRRHAATGTLVPGKSTGAPRKTTPRQDRDLFRMVWQDRFIGARALTARMRNLYEMRAGLKTINDRLLSRDCRAYRPTRNPLLTTNHRRLRLEWAQRWQNPTMARWQHVIFGDVPHFTR